MKYTLVRMNEKSNVFIIIDKKNIITPITMYGLIQVNGKDFMNSMCTEAYLHDQITFEELKQLEIEARKAYFEE